MCCQLLCGRAVVVLLIAACKVQQMKQSFSPHHHASPCIFRAEKLHLQNFAFSVAVKGTGEMSEKWLAALES